MAFGVLPGLIQNQPGMPPFPGQWTQPINFVPPPPADTPVPPPDLSVAPLPSTTLPPAGPGVAYDPTDPLGSYFLNNQAAGDAWAQLKATLDQYGLSTLYNFVEQGIVQGWDAPQAYQHIRETNEYKARFAGNALRVKNGFAELSENDYINTENAYAQAFANVGVNHFNTQQDFAKYIGANVSPVEMQDRLVKGYQAAATSDPQTKLALQRLYGITDGDLAAYFIDPTTTEQTLLNRFISAQNTGAAARAGWGDLSRNQAEYLTSLGVDASRAGEGFGKLAQESQLMQALPGDTGEGNISTDTQLAAAFANNAQAQQQIQQRAAQRAAVFGGGGGFVGNKEGQAGIGTAQ